MSELRYACVGGPPDDWTNLKVVNEATGLEVQRCVEVDCDKGFARVYRERLTHEPLREIPATLILYGRFRIERLP